MTGRPGHSTMETNGRNTVSYLVCTPRVPFFMLILIGLEAKGLLASQGQRGIASVVWWNIRPVIFGVDLSQPINTMIDQQAIAKDLSFTVPLIVHDPASMVHDFHRNSSDFLWIIHNFLRVPRIPCGLCKFT